MKRREPSRQWQLVRSFFFVFCALQRKSPFIASKRNITQDGRDAVHGAFEPTRVFLLVDNQRDKKNQIGCTGNQMKNERLNKNETQRYYREK